MAYVVGAVLAAGAGTRMGGPKADLVVDGVRLVERAVSALAVGGCDEILAVVRSGTVPVAGARPIVNVHPENGLRSSLALAVAAIDPGCAALAVVLVDMPGAGSDAVSAVVSAWRPGRIALARYTDQPSGRWAHPIVMSPDLWREALTLAGPDEGARVLLASRSTLIDEVSVVGSAVDLDSPSDLAAWNAQL